MTDEKKTRGVPFKSGDKRINRGGRPVGSRQKAPKIGELEDLFARGTFESVQVLLRMLRDDRTTDGNKLKVASKFIDTHLSIEKQGGKLRVEQTDKEGKKTSYDVTEEKKVSNGGGSVVSFTPREEKKE